ncbi:MAG: HEXXH motif-containing putative peptide modification protein [Hafnia sp.]
MLLQFGMGSVVRNIVRLVGTVSDRRDIVGANDLRKGFMVFLNRLQPRPLLPRTDELRFVENIEDSNVLKNYFSNDSVLDDKSQSEVILVGGGDDVSEKIRIVKSGLLALGELNAGYYEVFHLIMTDILVLPSNIARAGSTSQSIGVIWINPKLTYVDNDILEIIVHELTHQLMFLDELCLPHYNYEMIADVENWPVSAVLNINRPFDKVLHSAVVAMEIILLRRDHIGDPDKPLIHPPTDVLKTQLINTVNSMEKVLNKKSDILRDRGREVVDVLINNMILLR